MIDTTKPLQYAPVSGRGTLPAWLWETLHKAGHYQTPGRIALADIRTPDGSKLVAMDYQDWQQLTDYVWQLEERAGIGLP